MQCTTNAVSDVLMGKVDSALSTYPRYPYQIALEHRAIKQVLLNYVECKLKQAMPVLNEPDQWHHLPQYLNQMVDLELRLESYIYWGIEYIIQSQLDVLMAPDQIPNPTWNVQEMKQTCMPSYWFG